MSVLPLGLLLPQTTTTGTGCRRRFSYLDSVQGCHKNNGEHHSRHLTLTRQIPEGFIFRPGGVSFGVGEGSDWFFDGGTLTEVKLNLQERRVAWSNEERQGSSGVSGGFRMRSRLTLIGIGILSTVAWILTADAGRSAQGQMH